MEYSLDGEHLAVGCLDGSIRIWHTESFHATTSHPHMEIPTRTPKQADVILVDSGFLFEALSFSRTDSNLLASGYYGGVIKVWNIKEQACIHTFDPLLGPIRSLFFAGGTDIACLALAGTSVIRLWNPEGSSDSASGIIGNIDASEGCRLSAVFCPSGSFLATSKRPYTHTGTALTVTLYALDTTTTTKIQSVGLIANCIAVTPDSKQLAVGSYSGRIHFLQTDDFSHQRDLDLGGVEIISFSSIAFDPTGRVLAYGGHGGRLELRTL
jgi:WD40 repeat protein